MSTSWPPSDRESNLVKELTRQLAAVDDDGARRALLAAPAHLMVSTNPPGGRRPACRSPRAGRPACRRRGPRHRRLRPNRARTWLLRPRRERLRTVFHPLSCRPRPRRGRARRRPAAVAFPATCRAGSCSFRGASLVGAADSEGIRDVLNAEPQHATHVDGFLIEQTEVTFEQYLAYLNTLPAVQRAVRRPFKPRVNLAFDATGTPTLTMHGAAAALGAPFCRAKRKTRRCRTGRAFRWSVCRWMTPAPTSPGYPSNNPARDSARSASGSVLRGVPTAGCTRAAMSFGPATPTSKRPTGWTPTRSRSTRWAATRPMEPLRRPRPRRQRHRAGRRWIGRQGRRRSTRTPASSRGRRAASRTEGLGAATSGFGSASIFLAYAASVASAPIVRRRQSGFRGPYTSSSCLPRFG